VPRALGTGGAEAPALLDLVRKWGRLGGIATQNRYGNEFYREIRKKRKRYPAYVTRKTKQKMQQMMVDLYKAESNPFTRWAIRLYLQSQIREL
jgi:hypothetical protein